MKKDTETQTYDTAFETLQQILLDLQNDTVSIDDLATKIERAQELIRYCREKLRDIEGVLKKVND